MPIKPLVGTTGNYMSAWNSVHLELTAVTTPSTQVYCILNTVWHFSDFKHMIPSIKAIHYYVPGNLHYKNLPPKATLE
ncbi:hypothetical protein PIB30_105447, partial [Stylosanthes scabra]|nr:hypothetical protein [Stylosanthes scabra]